MRSQLLICLASLLHLIPAWGQDIYFQTLGANQGLSQSSAISFWQDSIGRIWIGNDALNCFDGETVKTYRLSEYFRGVEDSNIHTICGNASTLYVIAEDHLICFDLSTETFSLPGITTSRIYCKGNQLYYFADGDFYLYNQETDERTVILTLPEDVTSVTGISSITEGVFWISTQAGIYIIDSNQKRVIAKRLPNENITSLYKDSQNQIWAISDSRKLYVSTPEGDMQLVRVANRPTPDTFPTTIYSLVEDRKGSLWVGTLSGIFQLSRGYNDAGDVYIRNHVLPEATIFALFADRQGSVWIGSFYGDVRFFNPEVDNYTYYQSDDNHPDRFHGAVIGSIVKDKNQTLYIATEGSGINIMHQGSNKVIHLTIADGLPRGKIRSLWYDEKYDRIFIGTYMDGMCYLDIKTRQIHRIPYGDLNSNLQRIVEEIHPYKDDLMLLTQDGIFRLDRASLKISWYFDEPTLRKASSDIIRTIYIDDRNVLWISSFRSGLLTINLDTLQIIRNYGDGIRESSAIPSAIVNICGDSKRGLFLATLKSGIVSYDMENDSFHPFATEQQHLLSSICYNMTFSWYGNLIVTTNKGISILSIDDSRQIISSRHFHLSPTFPLSALSIDCGLYSSYMRDRIYVGGLYGLLIFSESDILQTEMSSDYTLYFSSLSINNKPISASSPLLKNSLYTADKITLPYNKNTLAISFASSNYLSSHTNRYEYKLEGLENYWTETDYKTIIFNSLRPGNYKLVVREPATNKSTELAIIIKPPVWATLPAYVIYTAIILLILWWFMRFNKSKLKLQLSLESERKEVGRIEEANRNKLNFFVNLSNEFRTPITLILSQLDRLSHDLPASAVNKIDRIQKQASRLQDLITELIDFRKLDQNRLHLRVKEHNLAHHLEEIGSLYQKYASEKQIIYRIVPLHTPVQVWFDLKQIQKTIYNLLTFVFKETTAKESITLSLHQQSKWAEIRITRKGNISDSESNNYLFDFLNNKTNMRSDFSLLPEGGIGLAFSKGILSLHRGEIDILDEKEKHTRTYIIRLLLGNTHFTEKELQDTSEPVEPLSLIHPEVKKESFRSELILTGDEEKGVHMLLIEENDEMREMLKEAFSVVYDVTAVNDAQAGYEYATREHPDIILSEINLHRLSGMEMCQMLKSNINTLHIPVVLMTSQPSEKQHIESIRSGTDAYIIKPFNIEILFLRCNHLVRNRKKILQNLAKRPEGETVEFITNSRDQGFLEQANQAIENNCSNTDYDTTAWSRDLGISRTRLFTQIKQITGMTPNDYILHLKMEKGMRLLTEDRDLTIAEIAYRLGFTNPAYFSKCFKKQFGITPVDFRKK